MAGGALKYRHLNRKSSHRQALLRNLVTSLITHESIQTTWPKAKEAQRLAEKLITLGKKNTNASRTKAESIFFEPLKHLPTLFTTLRQRYLNRPGGYTRVLRIEPLNRNNDQAPSAILELVDGPRDMRFAMTAKTLVRERASAHGVREITARNIAKVTRFREGGEEELESTVRKLETMKGFGEEEEEDEEKGEREREPWEPFARTRQREREKKDEERPLTAWEKWDERRTKRDPDSGRRTRNTGKMSNQ